MVANHHHKSTSFFQSTTSKIRILDFLGDAGEELAASDTTDPTSSGNSGGEFSASYQKFSISSTTRSGLVTSKLSVAYSKNGSANGELGFVSRDRTMNKEKDTTSDVLMTLPQSISNRIADDNELVFVAFVDDTLFGEGRNGSYPQKVGILNNLCSVSPAR